LLYESGRVSAGYRSAEQPFVTSAGEGDRFGRQLLFATWEVMGL
jgi:hypothetical protein